MTILQRLLLKCIAAGVLLALIWGLNAQRQAANARTQAALATLSQAIDNHGKAVSQLEATNQQMVTQYADMQAQYQRQASLNGAIRTRVIHLESLQREDENYRQWADQPLPDAVVRLRERPAITGADDYLQWLSTGDALPTAGDSPPAERPASQ